MSDVSEDALREGCARGDAAAREHALSLLSSTHAYDRAVAAESLAGSPVATSPELERMLLSEGTAPAWRALALRADAGAVLGAQALAADIDASLASVDDADARYFAVTVLEHLGPPGETRRRVVRTWAEDADSELALAAASLLWSWDGTLPDPILARLARIRGPLRPGAVLLRGDAGDRSVADDAVAVLATAGPLRFELLGVIERTGGNQHTEALRRLWRRWRPDAVSARAAGAAVALGDTAALGALSKMTRSRRVEVRAVARAELVRVGGAAERGAVLAALVRGGDASDAATLAALPNTPEVARAVAQAADGSSRETTEAALEWLATHRGG